MKCIEIKLEVQERKKGGLLPILGVPVATKIFWVHVAT